MKRSLCLVILGLVTLFLMAGYSNCLQADLPMPKVKGTEIGNAMTSMQIVKKACSVIVAGHPGLDSNQCLSGVLMTSFSDTLGVPSDILNPFRTLVSAEESGAIKADAPSFANCLSAFDGVNSQSSEVQGAYNPGAFNPFENVRQMIPTDPAGCPHVYSGNTLVNPTPTPPPLGITVVGFDNPPPPLSAPYLQGVFQGIDFGHAQWDWGIAYNADTTNYIYMDHSNENSASFNFSGGPKILESIQVFSKDSTGTLTISDESGQTVSQIIPADVNMHLVNTGFVNPSSIITINFSVAGSLGVDDITYINPASPPAISMIQNYGNYVSPVYSAVNPVSFNSDTTPGNFIIAVAQWFAPSRIQGIKDSQGNVYVSAPAFASLPDKVMLVQVWYASNIKGGPNTVTVEYDSSGPIYNNTLDIFEYSGVDIVDPMDVSTTTSGTSLLLDSGPVTTNFPNELIFGVVSNAYSDFVPDPGLVVRGNKTEMEKMVSEVGTYRISGTVSNSHGWTTQIITFKAKRQ